MERSLGLTTGSRSTRLKFPGLTSPSLPFLCISLFFLFLAPSCGRGNFTLSPDHLLIHGLSPFTNTTKKLRNNSGKHSNRYYFSWNGPSVEMKGVPHQCRRHSAVPPAWCTHAALLCAQFGYSPTRSDGSRAVLASPKVMNMVQVWLVKSICRWPRPGHGLDPEALRLPQVYRTHNHDPFPPQRAWLFADAS